MNHPTAQPTTRRYNHAYDIAFTVESEHPTGDDLTPNQIRGAIWKRLAELPDSELPEAVGMPFDTYEVQP
jgi:hypothetical protein